MMQQSNDETIVDRVKVEQDGSVCICRGVAGKLADQLLDEDEKDVAFRIPAEGVGRFAEASGVDEEILPGHLMTLLEEPDGLETVMDLLERLGISTEWQNHAGK